MFKSKASLSLVSVALLGCASSEGTKPHDRSAAGHDEEAAREEVLANQHAVQYNPTAVRERPACSGVLARKSGLGGDVCWGSVINPTEVHRVQADARRRVAVEHRAASQALRDAEAATCGGLSDEERDTSPFMHVEDIAMVAPLAAQRGQEAVVDGRARGGRDLRRRAGNDGRVAAARRRLSPRTECRPGTRRPDDA